MRVVEELLITFLDALALLAVAVGVLVGLWPLIHGWSIACGGAVVFLGARASEALSARRESQKT